MPAARETRRLSADSFLKTTTWGARLAILALITLLATGLSLADNKGHKLSDDLGALKNGKHGATVDVIIQFAQVPTDVHHQRVQNSGGLLKRKLDFIKAAHYSVPVQALDALAATLKPSELTVPKQVLDAIPPRPPGYGRHRELFPRTTGDGFDPLSPATVASDVTIGFTLQLDRAARMVAQHAVDPTLPGLDEVIDRLAKAVFDAPVATPYEAEVRRAEERVFVDRVMWLATGAPNGQVRAVASWKLLKLAARLKADTAGGESDLAQRTLLAADIHRFLERPADPMRVMPAPDAPPGAPIGEPAMDWLARPEW